MYPNNATHTYVRMVQNGCNNNWYIQRVYYNGNTRAGYTYLDKNIY